MTITRTEAAEILGCDPRTVSQAIRQGSIPAVRVGKRVVVLRAQFLALLANGNAAPERPLKDLRIS